MCFTKKLFEFVAPYSKFSIIESFRLVKSRFVPKKSTSGKIVDEIPEGCLLSSYHANKTAFSLWFYDFAENYSFKKPAVR